MEPGNKCVLLSSAYLAPVQYFTKLLTYDEVWIELSEHFLKQSYRNRCIILTANGPQSLSIPVTEGSNSKRLIRDVAISYDHPWQKLHWKAIVSAYNNAPFFEYYADNFSRFYHEKKWQFLADFNRDIQSVVLDELNLKCDIRDTETFLPPTGIPVDTDDFRYSIHPKTSRQTSDDCFAPAVYMQVFQEKFGFTPNLCILDLLFNEGPMAADILKSSIVK
ncbi:MAG: WbqC family protein [Prolixibacteraceae bacterium]|nr:WbqC family protein [Prolixibacteraceae bacterium]